MPKSHFLDVQLNLFSTSIKYNNTRINQFFMLNKHFSAIFFIRHFDETGILLYSVVALSGRVISYGGLIGGPLV